VELHLHHLLHPELFLLVVGMAEVKVEQPQETPADLVAEVETAEQEAQEIHHQFLHHRAEVAELDLVAAPDTVAEAEAVHQMLAEMAHLLQERREAPDLLHQLVGHP